MRFGPKTEKKKLWSYEAENISIPTRKTYLQRDSTSHVSLRFWSGIEGVLSPLHESVSPNPTAGNKASNDFSKGAFRTIMQKSELERQ